MRIARTLAKPTASFDYITFKETYGLIIDILKIVAGHGYLFLRAEMWASSTVIAISLRRAMLCSTFLGFGKVGKQAPGTRNLL